MSSLLWSAENTPADGYRGIWYSIGQDKGFGPKYSGGLGTYPANMVPMAVYDEVSDTTWFVYGGTTAESNKDLQIMIGAWHHSDDTVSRPTTVRDSGGLSDAHANPSMTIGPDGHLYIASATRHSFEGRIYRSLRPRDHSEFEVVYTGYIAYPQFWYHPSHGFIILHTRYSGSSRFLYSIRSQDGINWDSPINYARFNGHYQNSALLPDGSIVTAFNYHPGGVDHRTNIYVMRSSDGGQTWTDIDGNPLSLPLDSASNSALALDAEARDELVYIMDMAYDLDGNPIILYLTSLNAATGPNGDPRTWRVLHRDGTNWQERIITTSTNNYDLGSIIVDGSTWTVIGPTGTGPQEFMTGGEIAVWTSTNSGESWSSQALTRNSVLNHTYARRPVPYHDGFVAFWADGDASTESESSLYVSNKEGTVYQLPRNMNTDREAPLVVSTIATGNTPPSITSLVASENPVEGSSTQLTVTAGDPDGDDLNYVWNLISGPSGASPVFSSSAVTNVQFDSAGSYKFKVTVEDGRGGTSTATIEIDVRSIVSGISIQY